MRLPSCWMKVLVTTVALLLSDSEGLHSSSCQIWQADIQRSESSVKISRNYKGLWVSDKCEIHPGPQFLLRRYHILRNGRFHLLRFYFQDPWCTKAKFCVSAVGTFDPPPGKATSSSASWVVPGGMELDFTIRRINLVPFDHKTAKSLSEKVNSSCPGTVKSSWKIYKKYKVMFYNERRIKNVAGDNAELNSADYLDCTTSLDITFNELQLIRLEHRMSLENAADPREDSSEGHRKYRSHLFLGADRSKSRNRPTHYQSPLIPAQTTSCPVCRLLSKATATSAPELHTPRVLHLPPNDIEGQWMSLRCEVRPYGLFLKRSFVFSLHNKQWQGMHAYFKDPNCMSPMFTLNASGTFIPGPPSKTIPDAAQYDFQILDSTVTPEDQSFVSNMNGLPTCRSKTLWKLGVAMNLTDFGGCKELGVQIPSIELDLVRFEHQKPNVRYLFLGDVSEEQARPTSFQPPLVQCSDSRYADKNLLYNELRPLPLVSKSCKLFCDGSCFLSALILSSIIIHCKVFTFLKVM
ncbi:protein APCDD1-like [Uloborus diversus]|uniref:protein APCDD1-like n=1 Tax=Uloborus diversus TaxID=327109 RepID=UPI00240A51F2|nr:protein APCDD1-like [Uloborus diversus]